eukprot:g12442.t1
MIGLRSSSKEFRLGSSGFLSNLRGEYVKPMVDAIDTTPEGETGNLNGKADSISLTHTSGTSQSSPTPRLSSLFTPPLCIAPLKKASVATAEESDTENPSDQYDALRTLMRKNPDNDVSSSKHTHAMQRTLKADNAVPNQVTVDSTDGTKIFQEGVEPSSVSGVTSGKKIRLRGSKWRRKKNLFTYGSNSEKDKEGASSNQEYFRNSNHRLVLYKEGPMILVLTVNTDKMAESNMNDFCLKIEATAKKGLGALGKMLHDGYQEICARILKKGKKLSKHQYVYFNRKNLALKVELEGVAGSSIDMKHFKKGTKYLRRSAKAKKKIGYDAYGNAEMLNHPYWPDNSAILSRRLAMTYSPVVVRMINDIYTKLNEEHASMDEVRDIHVKLPSDGWVHGKKKGDRILIVLIDGRFSPVEAQNSVERLCQSVFKGIFV